MDDIHHSSGDVLIMQVGFHTGVLVGRGYPTPGHRAQLALIIILKLKLCVRPSVRASVRLYDS